MTAAYMAKLYVALFVEKPDKPFEESGKPYMNWQSALAVALPALALPILGLFPTPVMDGMAELMQGFMNGQSPEKAVRWFSLANLKGAAISLAIGAAVYFFVIRTLLMRKDKSGRKVYVNRWPDRLDLETLIYRPLAEKLLPFLGALISRILDNLTDWIVSFLNRTLLRPKPIPPRMEEDYAPGDYVPHVRRSHTLQRISGSISYSLLLFGLGFCAAMGYLIIILLTK